METPLNLLYVVEASSAGVGRHVIDLASQVRSMGHRVEILYSPLRMDEKFQCGIEKLRAHGIAATPLVVKRGPHRSDLQASLRLRRYLRSRGPFDVVHAHSTKAGILARPSALGLPGLRIYTPHAFLSLSGQGGPLGRWAVRRLERLLGRISHGIITVSEEEFRHGVSIGLPSSKLFMIPNGISIMNRNSESARREARKAIGLKDGEICIGFVGRLVPQKAPDVLLAAFSRVLACFPQHVTLAMAGNGSLAASLRNQAARLSLGDRVRWLGELDGSSIIPGFDIFCLPSRYEGLPYVLLEAMSAGVPIVSTRVGGAGLLVKHGENGSVIPADDPERLAEALIELLGNAALRGRMGANSLRRVREFTVEKMAAKTVAVYRTLLQPSHDRLSLPVDELVHAG